MSICRHYLPLIKFWLGAPKKNEGEAIIASVIDIALSGSAAHGKTRNEIIRSVKPLDQLTVALNNKE